MATPVSNSILLTGNPQIDGLLQGSSWQFGAGPRILTYSLDANYDVDVSGNISPGQSNWTSSLVASFGLALQAWADVANIGFQLIPSNGYAYNSTADISATGTANDLSELEIYALSVFPDPNFGNTFLGLLGLDRSDYPKVEGDLYFDNGAFGAFSPGNAGFQILLHEIGHLLGLKHPSDDGANGRPTFASLGVPQLNTLEQTLMVSEDLPFGLYPITPLLLDIQAIQQIYGPNMSYHTGNDVYALNVGSRNVIWDAGGIDTLDASAQPRSVQLDLRPGMFSKGQFGWSTAQTIAYGATIENAIGSPFDDTIFGNDSDNVLDGAAGADWMAGGSGDDTYIFDRFDDQAVEFSGQGSDTVAVLFSYGIGPGEIENLRLIGNAVAVLSGNEGPNILTGNDATTTLVGNGGNDTLFGMGGDDTLEGSAGADTLVGGLGNDLYYVDELGDTVVEHANEGIDHVQSSVSLTLAPNAEYLTLTGFAPLDGTGNELDNEIVGNSAANALQGGAGNDRLDGGGGDDVLRGGSGNDVYRVDSSADTVVELDGEGIDTVIAKTAYTLPANIENLTRDPYFTSGTFVGNDTDNRIEGGPGQELHGRGGDDSLVGGYVMRGDEGADYLAGSWGSILYGGLGDDTFEAALVQRPQQFHLSITPPAGRTIFGAPSVFVNDASASFAAFLVDVDSDSGAPDRLDFTFIRSPSDWMTLKFFPYSSGRAVAAGDYMVSTDSSDAPAYAPFRLTHASIGGPAGTGTVTVEAAQFTGLAAAWNIIDLRLTFELIADGDTEPFVGDFQVSNQPSVDLNQQIFESPGEGTDTLVLDASLDMTRTLELGNLGVENLVLHGNGRVNVVGTNADDVLLMNGAASTIAAAGGNDFVNGYGGTDTASYTGSYSQYTFVNYLEILRVVDTQPSRDGVDQLIDVEQLHFAGDSSTKAVTGLDMFTPLEYLASYPDLMEGMGANPAAGYEHYVNSGRLEGRTSSFDGMRYIASYADLMDGMGLNPNAGANHFINAGRFENRVVNFEAMRYIASYGDLIQGLGPNTDAGVVHYISSGRFEGRVPYFNGRTYIASYSDLISSLGDDPEAGIDHYVRTGYAEGRTITFNALAYIASYPDLIAGLGPNPNAGASHYINGGQSEGRTATFNAAQYLAKYADLAAAYGPNLDGATVHYIVAGHIEGRTDQPT